MFWTIFWEIIGYLGTALVIVSMLMTSIEKLRFINICGGILSLIYAISANTMPVVVLNATLVTINIIQLIRSRIKKNAEKQHTNADNANNTLQGGTL